MSNKLKVASNTLYQLVGRLITAAATILATIVIARVTGLETFGEYSIAITYITTFYIIADFGINAVLIKDFTKSEQYAKDHYGKVIAFRIIFGLFITMIAWALLYFMPYSSTVKIAILLALPLIFFQSIFRASATIFQAYLRYQYQTLALLFGNLLFLVLLWMFFKNGYTSAISVMTALVIGNSIIPVLGLIFTRKYISFSSKWIDINYWKYFFFDAFPLGISLLLNTLMIHADRWILSILSSPESVGTYFLAYKIFELAIVLPTFFMNAVYPIMVNARRESQQAYNRIFKKSIVILAISAVIISTVTILASSTVIPLIWGEELKEAYIPLNILMLGLIAFYLSSPLNWAILMEGKQKYLVFVYGIAFVFNATLNYILIPKYDYNAAAIVTIATECLVLIALVTIMRKTRRKALSD